MKKIRKFVDDKYHKKNNTGQKDGSKEEDQDESPNFIQLENHIFKIDMENIEKCVYKHQRRELLTIMAWCLFRFLMSFAGSQVVFYIGFNTYWILGLCIMIKLCIGSKVANIFKFSAAFVSFFMPKLLLDEHRQREVHRKYRYLAYFDIPIVLIVFYFIDEIGLQNMFKDQVKIELFSFVLIGFIANIYLALAMVIATIYLGLVFLIAPIYLVQVVLGICFQGLFILRKKRSVLEQIERLEKQTWKQQRIEQYSLQDSNQRCSVTECMICMSDFTDDCQVVQLKCHQDHTYHFECFKTFLTSQSDIKIIKPKCPLCRQPVKFKNMWTLKSLIRTHTGFDL